MILSAFRLARDPRTEGQTFGYQRPFWPDGAKIYHHFTPMLGQPLEVETTLVTNLVKMVECYQREFGMVVVERLAWAFGGQLYPYRIKYVRTAQRGYLDDPILFLPNMSTIHRKLTGLDVSFASPLQYYLNSGATDPWGNAHDPWYQPTRSGPIMEIYDRHRNAIDGLATQDTDWKSMRDFLGTLDHERSAENLERHFANDCVPKMPILDPISQQSWCRPLRSRDLAFDRPLGNPYDTTPVAELVIEHPAVTRYSPQDCHRHAMTCEEIAQEYTDIKLEYILSERRIADRTIHHMVSRYRDNPNTRLSIHRCDWLILDVLSTALGQSDVTPLLDNVVVSLQLTYGDEVLIEIYTPDKKHCLYAVHLDLALLALCASSVVAQVSSL